MVNRFSLPIMIFLLMGCGKEKVQREVSYYPNGSLRYEVKLVNGKRDGLGIQYFENGKIEAKLFWKNGKVDGEKVMYYENGNTRQISQYKEGTCLLINDFTEDGLLRRITWLDKKGRVIDYQTYDKGKRDFRAGTKNPIFIADKDTVSVEENYIAEVRLGNMQYDNIEVVLGDINDRYMAKKNPPLPKKDSLTSILNIKSDSVGLREISGVIIERSVTSDSLDVIPFVHRFYVTPAQRN